MLKVSDGSESLSAYARQFLEQMGKPDVDSIEGLSPAIPIDAWPLSTAGTTLRTMRVWILHPAGMPN